MIISQDYTIVRKASSNSKTPIISLREDVFKASGLELGDKVKTVVEEVDGVRRIIVEGVKNV